MTIRSWATPAAAEAALQAALSQRGRPIRSAEFPHDPPESTYLPLEGPSPDGDVTLGETFPMYEDHPERHIYETGGIKDNVGKSRVDLIPSRPLVAIGEVLAFGARKYRTWNWARGLPWSDTYASLMRHLLAWHHGEDLDPETGLSHLAHANCQALFLLDFSLTKVGDDDRWLGAANVDPIETNAESYAGELAEVRRQLDFLRASFGTIELCNECTNKVQAAL